MLIFPDGISYDRETGFGTADMGCIFELSRRIATKKLSAFDPDAATSL